MNPTLLYLSRQLLVPQISMVSSTVNLLKGAIFTQILFKNTLKNFNHAASQTPSTNLKYMKLSYALLIFYSKNSKMFQWTWHNELQLLYWHIPWYTNTHTVYKETFAPVLFSSRLDSMSEGKFKTKWNQNNF